jgi:hypothetical protein
MDEVVASPRDAGGDPSNLDTILACPRHALLEHSPPGSRAAAVARLIPELAGSGTLNGPRQRLVNSFAARSLLRFFRKTWARLYFRYEDCHLAAG